MNDTINTDVFQIIWYTNDVGQKISKQVLSEQQKIIVGSMCVLNGIPDRINRVQIANIDTNIMREIDIDEDIVNINEFKVNYNMGYIFFHPTLEGKTIIVTRYYSRGIFRLHDSRIFGDDGLGYGTNLKDLNTKVDNAIADYNNKINIANTRIDNIVANSGNSNTEIVDARMDSDGTVFTTLGSNIRNIDGNLKNPIYGNVITTSSSVNSLSSVTTRKQIKIKNIKGNLIADGVNPEKSIDSLNIYVNDSLGNTTSKLKLNYDLYKVGMVYDEINNNILTKRINKVALSGSLNWSFVDSNVGQKRVKLIGSFNAIYNQSLGIKYNNNILKSNIDTYSNVDAYGFSSSEMYISISNTDSGWGDNYTPTSDEIKAYFYGWKMSEVDKWNIPYNGTGIKGWAKIYGNTVIDGTGVLPTVMNDKEYTPYRLYYQLATPQIINLNLPNLVAEPNGNMIINTSSGLIPEIKYQICDNLKANVDELMMQVATDREYLNNTMAEQSIEWISPTMLNGWVNYGENFYDISYVKSNDGYINMRGVTRYGIISDNTILFNLPIGYRPIKYMIFNAQVSSVSSSITVCRIAIDMYGNVSILGVASNMWLSLDGISFKAEQ